MFLLVTLLLVACAAAPQEAAPTNRKRPPVSSFPPRRRSSPPCPPVRRMRQENWWITSPKPAILCQRWRRASTPPKRKSRAANPVIPLDATTMPPGFPMKIPIYYKALWGTPYQILPDSLFVNGPAQVGFDVAAFVNSQPGWFKTYREQLADGPRTGAELVQIVATNFSISPRLLLAWLEYYAGALSRGGPPADTSYLLNYYNPAYRSVYLQLIYTANTLNNGYYAWRRGTLLEFETPDGRLHRPDPWQNAATVAIQYTFSRLHSPPLFDQMIGPGGLAETYARLFGDPWQNVQPHIPASLKQPFLILPFEGGKTWNYTGGPHTGWGKGEPYAAIDFAPTGVSECNATSEWVTAMADGVVARSEFGQVVLDLDGDGDERTGWVLFYLHLATENRPKTGTALRQGDRLGHPLLRRRRDRLARTSTSRANTTASGFWPTAPSPSTWKAGWCGTDCAVQRHARALLPNRHCLQPIGSHKRHPAGRMTRHSAGFMLK